jgi:hypothetical protein
MSVHCIFPRFYQVKFDRGSSLPARKMPNLTNFNYGPDARAHQIASECQRLAGKIAGNRRNREKSALQVPTP